MRFGVGVMLVTTLLFLLFLALLFLNLPTRTSAGPNWFAGAGIALLLLWVVAVILSIAGWWFFTSKDPGVAPTHKAESLRQRVRWLLAAWLTLSLAPLASLVLWRGLANSVPWVSLVVEVTTSVLMVLWIIAAMRYTRVIGDRIPDASIRTRSEAFSILGIAFVLIQLLLQIASLMMRLQFQAYAAAMTAYSAQMQAYQAQLQANQQAGQSPPPMPMPPNTLISGSFGFVSSASMCLAIVLFVTGVAMFIVYAMLVERLRMHCRAALDRALEAVMPPPTPGEPFDGPPM